MSCLPRPSAQRRLRVFAAGGLPRPSGKSSRHQAPTPPPSPPQSSRVRVYPASPHTHTPEAPRGGGGGLPDWAEGRGGLGSVEPSQRPPRGRGGGARKGGRGRCAVRVRAGRGAGRERGAGGAAGLPCGGRPPPGPNDIYIYIYIYIYNIFYVLLVHLVVADELQARPCRHPRPAPRPIPLSVRMHKLTRTHARSLPARTAKAHPRGDAARRRSPSPPSPRAISSPAPPPPAPRSHGAL